MNTNSLIILGNGASLKTVDFSTISDIDTFGLNNGFIKYDEMNWYPKYYGAFTLRGSKLNIDGVAAFIQNNYSKVDQFYYNSLDLKSKLPENLGRCNILNLSQPKNVALTIDSNNYEIPLNMAISLVNDLITDEIERKKFQIYLKVLNAEQIKELDKLKPCGILSYFRNEPIDKNNYITKPRYMLSWVLPKTLTDFTFFGANSAVIAARIGYVLGYKKIILLGVDMNWEIKERIVDTKNTYWFDNYFEKDYNINDYCSKCTPESLHNMHVQSWVDFKKSLDVNKVDIDIVNCSSIFNSNISVMPFRQSTLEKELL